LPSNFSVRTREEMAPTRKAPDAKTAARKKKTVCRAITKWICYAVLALLVLTGLLVAWCSTTLSPEGSFFATVIPLIEGSPPQTLFGSLVKPSTPPVPAEMTPLPRPAGESFVTLPGTGDQMPANGLGMCCRASAYDDESVRRTVLWYLLQGGRHIDTAMLYLNHKPIGRAIEEAIARGVPRREIFVVTKLTDRAYAKGKATIDALLLEFARELRVEYIDLVLLHLPNSFFPIGHNWANRTCTSWADCRKAAWRVCHTGLEPRTSKPRTVCYAHVRASPWSGARRSQGARHCAKHRRVELRRSAA
jgi:hypothetical protein